MTMYVPLFTKSNYSFLEGASHPEELVAQADKLGLLAMALTDRDGFYGIVRAYGEARRRGIRLLVGSQVSIDDGSTIVLLAMTRRGYANLSGLITGGQRRCQKGESRVTWREIADHSADLIALWGGRESLLTADERPDEIADLLRRAFGDRLYALITRHFDAEEDARRAQILARADRYGLPAVAAVEVLYHRRNRRPLQDVLTCVKRGVHLDEASALLRPNAEHLLARPDDFARRFADHPEAIERTKQIATRCTFSMDDLDYTYPVGEIPDGYAPNQWLRELTLRGARARYGKTIPDAAEDQLVREFAVIEELEYAGYFLTMKEIVDYCDRREILCQGRGSAANSAVCYCLGITAVDPVKMDLLFERFISRERAEPPDIDLDIGHERREEVIQYVYERYGRHRAAMVANVIRYRPRSAVRDVGKALGLTEVTVDRLARLLSRHGELEEEQFHRAGLDAETSTHRHLLRLTNEILDFPRHLSIHPGGFILTEGAISDLVPVENATKENRTVIQWDKYDVEAMGLFKVDLLGLGGLTQLDKAFRLLRKHDDIDLDMARLPVDDADTYDMICDADTLGVFQIESRAQMSMLPRLRPRHYYDLVIQISIIRPGPITGDMVHPYLRRRQGKEPVDYPHPDLIPVLKKTLGIPLFQEQVMRLAIVAADYTPGEADQLRRDMAAWKAHGKIDRHRERLITRMIKNGIEREFAERIFGQIQGFADYGFPESHAASFALIAYATAYLRCHHPEVFSCSLLNAQPMGFYSPASVVEDARRRGIEVRPIDVRHSHRDCTLEPASIGPHDYALRMGLRYVKGLRKQSIDTILSRREKAPFEDLDDFHERTELPSDDLRRLAESGALESFELPRTSLSSTDLEADMLQQADEPQQTEGGTSRRQAIWRIEGLEATRDAPLTLPLRDDEQKLVPTFRRLDQLETIRWDYRTSYHSPRGHPLEPLRPVLRRIGLPTAQQLNEIPDGRHADYAGLVICRQRPSTASGVIFMTVEDETGLANIVIFPNIAERYLVLVRTQAFLGISGRIQNQEGVTHLIARRLWTPRLPHSPAKTDSRDFR